MEVKLPTEGTRYVQALLLTATAYLQYRAHFLPAVAAYRGYGRPAVPKVPVQALRACLAIGHGTLPLPSVAWCVREMAMSVTTQIIFPYMSDACAPAMDVHMAPEDTFMG
jgi:hypothetical protein